VSAFEVEDHIKFETWEDIVNSPSHQASVDTWKFRSCRVKGLYAFRQDDASCGASDCQKQHSKGFVVVYSGEKETNLCEECGQRLIGTSYKEQEQAFGDHNTLRQQKIRLNALLEQNENLKDRVRELKIVPYGANWLYRSLSGFEKAYPAELLVVLRELANNVEDDAALDAAFYALIERDTTEFQREQLEQLEGLGIFNADIKETLIGNILKPLKELEELVRNPESIRSLARLCKWADSIDDHFALAETLVNEGRLFFKTENMERLKSIPLSEKNTKLTHSIRWNCDEGMAR
jgi:hypothetical protein